MSCSGIYVVGGINSIFFEMEHLGNKGRYWSVVNYICHNFKNCSGWNKLNFRFICSLSDYVTFEFLKTCRSSVSWNLISKRGTCVRYKYLYTCVYIMDFSFLFTVLKILDWATGMKDIWNISISIFGGKLKYTIGVPTCLLLSVSNWGFHLWEVLLRWRRIFPKQRAFGFPGQFAIVQDCSRKTVFIPKRTWNIVKSRCHGFNARLMVMVIHRQLS